MPGDGPGTCLALPHPNKYVFATYLLLTTTDPAPNERSSACTEDACSSSSSSRYGTKVVDRRVEK